jgi:hypothetical protein
MWSLSYRATLKEEFNLDLCLGAPFPFPGYEMALIFVIKGSVQGGSFWCCSVRTYVDKGIISGSIILELCCCVVVYVVDKGISSGRIILELWYYSVRTYVDKGISSRMIILELWCCSVRTYVDEGSVQRG